MSADSDIKATVERIDQRISKLNKIKEMLLEEFSIPMETAITGGRAKATASRRRAVRRSPPRTSGKPRTRRQVLIDFFRTNGPAPRREIIEKTGMPLGTASYLLNDKKTFTRLDSGKWDIRKGNEPHEVT